MNSKKSIIISLILLSSITIKAHPGIGLVYDGDKTIFYTDLIHVWKLNIENGDKEIAVKDVHTHELYLDEENNLYGEHYWYIESEEKFKNFIWQLDKNGNLQKIREDQYGENDDFSFTRNDNFASFEVRQSNDIYMIIKKDSINETILHKAKLNHPTWKYLTANEELLFIDYPSIYSAKSKNLELVKDDISSKRFPFSTQSTDHNIYGVWTDKNDNIYVAIYGGREVKKINREGNTSRIVKSSLLWSPVNGVFDKNGNLWLMECKIGGKIRVREINSSEIKNNATFIIENSISILILVGVVFITHQRIKRRKKYAQ